MISPCSIRDGNARVVTRSNQKNRFTGERKYRVPLGKPRARNTRSFWLRAFGSDAVWHALRIEKRKTSVSFSEANIPNLPTVYSVATRFYWTWTLLDRQAEEKQSAGNGAGYLHYGRGKNLIFFAKTFVHRQHRAANRRISDFSSLPCSTKRTPALTGTFQT